MLACIPVESICGLDGAVDTAGPKTPAGDADSQTDTAGTFIISIKSYILLVSILFPI